MVIASKPALAAWLLCSGVGVRATDPPCLAAGVQRAVQNPSSWMQSLDEACPHEFRGKQLINISLPGSHDASAYLSGLSDGSVCNLILGRAVCHNWFLTQSGNVSQQLEAGSRFFDIRAHWSTDAPNCKSEDTYSENCWVTWHPQSLKYAWIFKVPGLDFAPLPNIVSQFKSFMLAHPKEFFILRLKLQQFVDKSAFSGINEEQAQKRLAILQKYLQTELGNFIGNLPNHTWWHWKVGGFLDSGKPLILYAIGDNYDLIAKYAPWLASYWGPDCKTAGKCHSPFLKTGYSNVCCDADAMIQNQIERQEKAYAATAGSYDTRPMIALSYQFTFKPKLLFSSPFASLRDASYILKPKMLELYNAAVADGVAQQRSRILPVSNVLGMDFVNDCPSNMLGYAVCGSVLPHGTPCNASLASFPCPPLLRGALGGSSIGPLLGIMWSMAICCGLGWCCCLCGLCAICSLRKRGKGKSDRRTLKPDGEDASDADADREKLIFE